MSEKISRAALSGLSFIGISGLTLALIITTFAYFEILSPAVVGKLVYASFVIIFFMGTSIVAKHLGEKGWMVGFVMALGLIILNLLYYTIGVEASLNFTFLIRCSIILVICMAGGMIGVNLPGEKSTPQKMSKPRKA